MQRNKIDLHVRKEIEEGRCGGGSGEGKEKKGRRKDVGMGEERRRKWRAREQLWTG